MRVGHRRRHELADRIEDHPKLGESYFFSISFRRRTRSLWVAISSRSRTKARMISLLTCTARVLRNTLESIETPCTVKA